MLKINIPRLGRLIGWTFFFLFLTALFAFALGFRFTANASNDGNVNLKETEKNLNPSAMKQTFSGVTMSVANMHQEGEYFQVDVCYSLPDDRDWILTSRPEDAVLNVDSQAYTVREEGVLDLKFASDGVASEKCQYLLFPVEVQNGANLVLSLKKVYVSEPDRVDCPALQKQLDERNGDVKVKCPTESNVGGFEIDQKPVSMDSESAREFALDILTDARKGPWVFHSKFAQP